MDTDSKLRTITCLAGAAFLAGCTGAVLLAGCSGSGGHSGAPGATSHAIHVSAAAPSSGSGSSWADALNDLGAALDLAQPGDQIWVAEGTYRPAPPNGDRLASFAMKSDVALYGGFAGDETQLAQRVLGTHVTILSGDLDGDDGVDFANSAENSIHVVVALGVDDHAVLDGFAIKSGRADGPGFGDSPDSQDQGSALNIFGGAPVIRNCMFVSNWSADHGSVNDHGEATTFVDSMWCSNHAGMLGGGLYVHTHSQTTVLGCSFLENDAVNDGGGTYCRSEHGAIFQDCLWTANRAVSGAGMFNAEASGAHVENCSFFDNVAGNGGGGIFCERALTVVENCLFENNDAGVDVTTGGGGGGGSGGGGFWSTGGSPFVSTCMFRHNAASFGGGVYHIEDSAAVVVDCDFEGNRAGEGGGLYTLSSPSHASGCNFIGNTASGTTFSVGGGMSNYFSASVVDNCLFRGNRAELGGGGMYCEGETPLFTNLRFEGNEAYGDTEGFGGGLLDGYHTHSTIVNCTFALNRAKKGGAIHEMFASAGTIVNCSFATNRAIKGGTVFYNDDSVSTYRNCVIWGSTPGDHVGPIQFTYGCSTDVFPGAAGCINVDPRFVRMPSIGPDLVWGTDDDDFGDLHLRPDSPCIDAGANRAVPPDVIFDVDGAPRFHDEPLMPDTGLGSSPVVDMGAFEVN